MNLLKCEARGLMASILKLMMREKFTIDASGSRVAGSIAITTDWSFNNDEAICVAKMRRKFRNFFKQINAHIILK